MTKSSYWDVGSLATALAGTPAVAQGRMGLAFAQGAGAEGVIQVTLHECGDLVVLVGVAGLEVQASVALVPVADIHGNAAFEHNLLKANKLLPLSTFGITEIGGREFYEIFGQMSGASALDQVVEEIETLGRNAIEATEMIEGWKQQKSAA